MIGMAMMHATHDARRVQLYHNEIAHAWRSELQSDPVIVVDHQKSGPWDTAKRAWLAAAAIGSTYSMVLQDDFLPCSDFIRLALSRLSGPENEAVCVFQPAGDPIEIRAIMNCASPFTIRPPHIPWGGSLIVSTGIVHDMLRVGEMLSFAEHDDMRLAAALTVMGVGVRCQAPSLMRHEGARFDPVPSEYRHGFSFAGR